MFCVNSETILNIDLFFTFFRLEVIHNQGQSNLTITYNYILKKRYATRGKFA